MNEVFNEQEKQKISEMEAFLKEAFCIDGDCNFIEMVKVNSSLKPVHSMLFALGDTKRGMFYITISQ